MVNDLYDMIRVSCEEMFDEDVAAAERETLLDDQEESYIEKQEQFYIEDQGDDECHLFVVLDGKGKPRFDSRNRLSAEKKCDELNRAYAG